MKKAKKPTDKTKYEALVAEIKTYLQALRGVRGMSAFHYKKTEQLPEVHGLADGPKQFNIVQIQELINHVMTAKQLGYKTVLGADPNTLTVNFIQDAPNYPYTWSLL